MIDYEEAQNISNHQNEVTNNDDRSTCANGDQSANNEVVIEEVQNVSEHETSDVQRQLMNTECQTEIVEVVVAELQSDNQRIENKECQTSASIDGR